MDLRLYYQKIRQLEAAIVDEFPIVVSKDTGDGGKSGVKTEVPRHIAAKLVVEGHAEVATLEIAREFRAVMAESKRMIEQAAQAERVQLTVLSTADFNRMKTPARSTKE